MIKRTNYKNDYSVSEFIRTGISFVLTKVFWPRARLVRYPIYIRGKHNIEYGKGLNIGLYCRIDALIQETKTLFIGENLDLGDFCHISALNKVKIGNNFICGNFVYIGDISHGLYTKFGDEEQSKPDSNPKTRPIYCQEVTIGDNVWIGEHCSILPGTVIGDGCVIGANSVVKGNIPNGCMAVGCPAKIVKKYNVLTKEWEKI